MKQIEKRQGNREPPNNLEKTLQITVRQARRIVVAVVGGTLLVIGIVMMIMPGPATVIIPLALLLLATEFAWARRWLRRVKSQLPESFQRKQVESEETSTRGENGHVIKKTNSVAQKTVPRS